MICCSARRPKRQLFVKRCHVTGANFLSATDGEPFNPSPNAVLILTLRMGFGHLRIAHAVASWLDGREAYVYDLLATDTPESDSLKRYEWIYSKFSKVASASGGPIEWAFDKFLTSGDASAQCVPACPPPVRPAPTRRACPPHPLSAALGRNKLRDVALKLKPLTDGIPLDITVVATHAVAGHIAVEAGFRKVINLVVDNYAQHFNAVPGAINAVQAGALGAAYAKLGYQTVLAGHWADRRSAEGIHTDTARRMKRIHSKAVRRLVIAIGGAGAQATFVIELLAALQPGMAAKTWHVVLNCGDAKETQTRIQAAAATLRGVDVQVLDTWDPISQIWAKDNEEQSCALTLVCVNDRTQAIATTDILIPRSDMACFKPGELAFIPAPKLLIRRVGAHEAASAVRAAELGDATAELRTKEDFEKTIHLVETTDLLSQMNRAVVANEDHYMGCKRICHLLQQNNGVKNGN